MSKDRWEGFTFCHLCTNHCSLKVKVENNRVIDVVYDLQSGFPCDPCPKGRRTALGLVKYHVHERLKYPLLRVGERGEGKWKRISWDEALKLIVDKLNEIREKYGPESVAVVLGEPKGLEFFLGHRFASAFGTPTVVTPGNYCGWATGQANRFTFGTSAIGARMEANPKVIMIWGANILHTGGTFTGIRPRAFKKAVEKGTKVVVIDPINLEYANGKRASEADYWLRVRPGSDGLLAYGLIKVIVEEGLYDEDYVNRWTVGFDKLCEELDKFTLKDIEKLTWVSKEEIEEVARLYATSKPAIIGWGNGIERTINSLQICRAIAILRGITGNVNTPNGGEVEIIPPPPAGARNLVDFMLLKKSAFADVLKGKKRKILGSDIMLAIRNAFIPTQLLIKAILDEEPYPIKAAIFSVTNPMVTYPDTEKVYKALMKLELIVVSEIFMTPTADIADIILPAATFYEHETVSIWPSWYGLVRAHPKFTDPPGEAWSDIKIWNELGKRLGLGEYFWDSEREILDYFLRPAGISFDEFIKIRMLYPTKKHSEKEVTGYNTPSGKVEIYSEQLKKFGINPIPQFEELAAPISGEFATNDEFPYVLANRKDHLYINSSFKCISGLRELSNEPKVWINDEVGKELGIEDGDFVTIETKKGKTTQKAILDEHIHPKVIIATFGWWYPEWFTVDAQDPYRIWMGGVNIETLTSLEPFDKMLGTPQINALPCRILRS